MKEWQLATVLLGIADFGRMQKSQVMMSLKSMCMNYKINLFLWSSLWPISQSIAHNNLFLSLCQCDSMADGHPITYMLQAQWYYEHWSLGLDFKMNLIG